MARRLMGQIRPAQSRAFDADWNWAVAVFFHSQWALDEAKRYIEDALALSSDGELLLAAARLFETIHADRTALLREHYHPGLAQGPRPVQERLMEIARAKSEIARAETLLRDVIAAGAARPVARLRLGRVLQVTGRAGESGVELQALVEQEHGQDKDTAYLARLFLARMFEEEGKSQQAIALYEAATQFRPRNQTARIGLARLLAESGRRDEANALVIAALTTERERSDEPWWAYYYPDESALPLLVAKMRERLR
jgi:tetratricopeptide (TPR) repeat protein